MARITFNAVIHEENDGSLWAEVRELPGCFASGFSIEELREALIEAIQLSLPEGISFGEPEWGPMRPVSDQDSQSSSRSREMLVCA